MITFANVITTSLMYIHDLRGGTGTGGIIN